MYICDNLRDMSVNADSVIYPGLTLKSNTPCHMVTPDLAVSFIKAAAVAVLLACLN